MQNPKITFNSVAIRERTFTPLVKNDSFFWQCSYLCGEIVPNPLKNYFFDEKTMVFCMSWGEAEAQAQAQAEAEAEAEAGLRLRLRVRVKLRLRLRALVRAGGRRRERGVKARANTRASWVRE